MSTLLVYRWLILGLHYRGVTFVHVMNSYVYVLLHTHVNILVYKSGLIIHIHIYTYNHIHSCMHTYTCTRVHTMYAIGFLNFSFRVWSQRCDKEVTSLGLTWGFGGSLSSCGTDIRWARRRYRDQVRNQSLEKICGSRCHPEWGQKCPEPKTLNPA